MNDIPTDRADRPVDTTGVLGRFRSIGIAPDLAPAAPGTYAIVLRLAEPTEFAVGSRGVQSLLAGHYAYCGSALGPGGLRARVNRHLRADKRRRWHVDFLRAVAAVVDIWITESSDRLECELAAALASRSGASRPIARFGSSDCGCAGHLVRIAEISPNAPRGSML